jgi:hypothetical protein
MLELIPHRQTHRHQEETTSYIARLCTYFRLVAPFSSSIGTLPKAEFSPTVIKCCLGEYKFDNKKIFHLHSHQQTHDHIFATQKCVVCLKLITSASLAINALQLLL